MGDPFNFDHVMTVAKLRAALEGLPHDMPVVLQKDAEGNGYSPLAEADQAMYYPDSTWSGQAYLMPEELAEKVADPRSGWSNEDGAPDGSVRVLLLGPVN